MAFNVNELNVIRSYVAVNGDLPDQSVLNQAFDSTSLTEALASIANIPPRSDVSNADFVATLYTNSGVPMDGLGQDYWVSLLRDQGMSRSELVGHFQYIVRDAGTFETIGDDAGTAGLVGSGSEFAEVSGPGTDDPDTTPEDLYTDVVFDTGEVQFASEGSPGHAVYNLGWDALNEGAGLLSKDYTFTLKDQINGGDGKANVTDGISDFDAYFLSPLLDPTASFSGSRLQVRVADRLAPADDKESTLENVQVNDFTIGLNGQSYSVAANDNNGLAEARTYEELIAAIEIAVEELIAENPELGDAGLSVRLEGEFVTDQYDENDVRTGQQVRGDAIVFEVSRGTLNKELFTASVTSGSGGGSDGFARAFDLAGDTVTGIIETDLVLDNVGYGSQGGRINISGQSASDKGVEVFNVDAQNGVWLTELSSRPLETTFDALKVINLTGSGYFRVGKQVGKNEGLRNDQLVEDTATAGLEDVRKFDGGSFNGDIRLDADITDAVIERDLDAVDTQGNPAADNVVYEYTTAAGDDQILLNVDGKVVEREDASVAVSTGAGDDQVRLELEFNTLNELVDQKDLDNVTINSGSGNDVIRTPGAGDIIINAGSGNDTVYTDNTGNTATNDSVEKAQWLVNAVNTDINDIEGAGAGGASLLYGAKLTVTLSGASVAAAGGVTTGLADALNNGFEATVDIPTPLVGGFFGNQAHVNQAIKDAIDNDPVLSKLLVAKDGPDNSVIIESLIDGQFEVDDLDITVDAVDINDLSSSQLNSIKTAMEQAAQNSELDPSDAAVTAMLNGSASAAETTVDPVFATDGVNYSAPVAQEQSLDFAGVSVLTADTTTSGDLDVVVNVNGTSFPVTVTLADGDNDAAVATKVHAALTADPALIAVVPVGDIVLNGTSVEITYPLGSGSNAAPTVSKTPGNDTVWDSTAETAEVQTVDFNAVTGVTGTGNVVVGGVAVALTNGDDNLAVATKVAAALNGQLLTAPATAFPVEAVVVDSAGVAVGEAGYDASTGYTVQITYNVDDADVTNVTIVNGTAASTPADLTADAVITEDTKYAGPAATAEIEDVAAVEDQAFQAQVGNIGDVASNITGTNSSADTDNTINLGNGDDVLVLSTSASANETIEITGYNNGDNTIVNFSDDGSSIDQLDLSAYLTSQVSASGSATSQQLVSVSVNTFNANSVIDFSGFDFTAVTDENWDNLTSSKLLDAVKDNASGYAGVNDLTGSLGVVNDLVGDSRKHVVFVENNLNDGEYKLFELTSTQTNGDLDFSGAELIGVFDFGDDIGVSTTIIA